MTSVLQVENLRISFPDGGRGRAYPVDGVSFALERGRTLALVGESGSGKSLTSLALLRLVPPPGRIEEGSAIRLGDTDVLALHGEALRRIRGRRIGMVFQDPMTSLNPVFTVGDQIAEGVRAHFPVSRTEARQRALRLLQEVGIPDPGARLDAYPHQLSGGQLQRLLIARALLLDIRYLIADEIISMLDASTRIDVLNLLGELKARGLGILFITHDLSLGNYISDRTMILRHGRVVELGSTPRVFDNPVHPYTKSLIASVPQLHTKWSTLGRPTPQTDDEDTTDAGTLVEIERDHFVLTTGETAAHR